jgi:hypothetical protein
MPQRLFSHEEAEAMLPEIAPLMWQAQRLKQEHDRAQQELAKIELKGRGNGHSLDAEAAEVQQTIQRAAAEINAIMARVQAMDVEVKDLDLGLVDFPSQRDDRVVYLCWKLGEEGIGWWHELDSGYASRQRLE